MSSLVRYVIGSCISSVIAPAVKATACARAASITIDESSGAIRYLQHETRGYEEFPVADELQSFDASDRKFVAAAVAAGPDAEIAVALDRGCWNHRAALESEGLRIKYVCEDDLREIAERRN